MKANYAAWEIDAKNFPWNGAWRDQAGFLIRYAVLAPSSHNAQPWRFSIGDREIVLSLDETRLLPVSDPDKRMAYIGIGCALENLLTAAKSFGFTCEISRQESSVRVVFSGSADQKNADLRLLKAMTIRRMNRGPYTDDLPAKDLLSVVAGLKEESAGIVLFTDAERKNKVADLLMKFREGAFASKKFRKEIASYKRNNFTRDYLGMPGFTMGFGNLFSLVAGIFIRLFNVMKFIKKPELELLKKHTPVFGFVLSKNNDTDAWIRSGRVFERMALLAEDAGVSVAISAVPSGSKELSGAIGTDLIPQVFFRLGYSKSPSGHSPRLPAEMVIKQ